MPSIFIAALTLTCFTRASASFEQALVITSSRSLGSDYATRQICTSEPLRELNGKIYSDFKLSRTGASWETSTIIVSQDAQYAIADEVDTSLPIGLRLSLAFSGHRGKTWIHAVNIANTNIKSQGLLNGSAPYCGMPPPTCFEKQKCYTMKPPLGWSTMKSTKRLAASVVNLNLTGLADPRDISVQVWAVPEGVTKHARWSTPIFTVLNWQFVNLKEADEAEAMDEAEEEEEEEEEGGQADWSGGGGGSEDAFSGFDKVPGESSGNDFDGEEDVGPTATIPPPVTMSGKDARKTCPVWQHMACMLDVLEKACNRDEGSPRKLIGHKHPENVHICCCPWPYKKCTASERNKVCDQALEKYITPLGKRPSNSAIRTALQDARGYMRTAESSSCAGVTFAAKPYTVCGRKADPPVERALARQELYCEMMTWQTEEMGDGTKEEFEANGCPYPENPASPGDGKWRKGSGDWSGH